MIAATALAACASAPTLEDDYRPVRPPRTQHVTPLSRHDVVGGMRTISPRVVACYDSYRKVGDYSAHVTIAPTGQVAAARVDGPDAATSQCIAAAVSGAVFPRFIGEPTEIDYPFVLR